MLRRLIPVTLALGVGLTALTSAPEAAWSKACFALIDDFHADV